MAVIKNTFYYFPISFCSSFILFFPFSIRIHGSQTKKKLAIIPTFVINIEGRRRWLRCKTKGVDLGVTQS